MQWIMNHSQIILSVLLILSESAAAVCQILWPDNKGVSGALATVIKLLQGASGKGGEQK